MKKTQTRQPKLAINKRPPKTLSPQDLEDVHGGKDGEVGVKPSTRGCVDY